MLLARAPAGLACAPGAIVISSTTPPADYMERCRPAVLIDPADLSARGGGLIYVDAGVRIERAQPNAVRRAWTPLAISLDQE
jgi:hypothetical protein